MALKRLLQRLGYLQVALLLIAAGNLSLFTVIAHVQAIELDQRSVTISSSLPSATVTNFFQFIYESTGTLGSIVFDYCDNTPIKTEPCSAPPGLDVTGASLGSQTGNTGFSVDSADTTANKLVISRIPTSASAITPTSYSFSNLINTSAANHTVFVRIASYASADGSGPITDSGSVAYATTVAFDVSVSVPPFLKICVAITVSADCSTAVGNSLNLGTLSTSRVTAGASQFAGGTNSISGYSVFVLGTTMTSGNNVITANSSPATSQPGKAQFGLNLRANGNPAVGSDPSGPGTALPTSNYNSPNLFKFNSGDMVASDSLPSNFKKMTVSYIVNIPAGQPLGVYATTMTYEAVGQF